LLASFFDRSESNEVAHAAREALLLIVRFVTSHNGLIGMASSMLDAADE
jgi:hypothetical protein